MAIVVAVCCTEALVSTSLQYGARGFRPPQILTFTRRLPTDLSEDIPAGLVVIKGIALLAGVDTPTIDAVMYWCQSKAGKKGGEPMSHRF